MKVIFLDFDGVLRREMERPGVNGATAYRFGDFDQAAVARLNAIASRTGASVVVTSSWKRSRDDANLADLLRAAGYTGPFCGSTPNLPGESERPGGMRGHEIAAWIAEHAPLDAFVMIDDGPHTSGLAWLTARFVQTASADGLQDEHVERAVALLARAA